MALMEFLLLLQDLTNRENVLSIVHWIVSFSVCQTCVVQTKTEASTKTWEIRFIAFLHNKSRPLKLTRVYLNYQKQEMWGRKFFVPLFFRRTFSISKKVDLIL